MRTCSPTLAVRYLAVQRKLTVVWATDKLGSVESIDRARLQDAEAMQLRSMTRLTRRGGGAVPRFVGLTLSRVMDMVELTVLWYTQRLALERTDCRQHAQFKLTTRINSRIIGDTASTLTTLSLITVTTITK